MQHSFNNIGYVDAKIIPAGARNIRVEEVAEANNYLAVKNEQGKYYLNGHWVIQWSGDFEAGGTIIHYQRDGNKESFNAAGPLKEPLHIMVKIIIYDYFIFFRPSFYLFIITLSLFTFKICLCS